ncbi:MAG: prolyl oligopeptidase family serine peptidase [Gemmatimonadales bacterium]
MLVATRHWLLLVLGTLLTTSLGAQTRQRTPIRQSNLTFETATTTPLTLLDAARDDRWLGLGVRDVRWAADGEIVYFRWNQSPTPEDLDEADPWFRADRDGEWAERVPEPELENVPGSRISWGGTYRAAWSSKGSIYLYDRDRGTRRLVTPDRGPRHVRMSRDGDGIYFEMGEALYRYQIADGALAVVAKRVERKPEAKTAASEWLAAQQRELLTHVRAQRERRWRADSLERREPGRPQLIPLAPGETIDDVRLSPDGRFVTFVARKRDTRRPQTQYIDYVDGSGYARVHDARSKVGEPRDLVRMGVVTFDPTVPVDSVEIGWLTLPEAGEQNTVPHGPFWNLEGTRAVVQFIGEDHRDIWYAEVDLTTGGTTVLAHDHDDAWIGGPPIQANYLQPALLEWLPGDRFVFASERSGWSHLYLIESDNTVRPLTSGPWEVRGATLSRDRSQWLLRAGREHPAEDHLYLMPATGGEMVRLTVKPGRHVGFLSPDGTRLAVLYGESVQMPDLFLRGAAASAAERRVTVSGTDAYYEHPLVRPQIVSFRHPDGGPLWAALFKPAHPAVGRPAILHIHGGGYRQFAHRGWTVYGYALHLGLINYLVQHGYTVLDFDYRGSAGYGRDYRTDIARSMGIKDVDGAVAAARYLVREHGVDSARIGMYGVSYGGFMTLMSLFRYPGVFAAGVARAAVTDWAHYSDRWTSRILGLPHEDPGAYRRSSPIYYAEGLQDALLITHGLVDNNVHFQDAARLVQRLIELEKDFDVMYYPVEPHTIQTETSRYDYVKRAVAFFDAHLQGERD